MRLAAGIALPVHLLTFTSKTEAGQIKLNWATANEINSDYFDVERSMDAKVYQKIGTIQAFGTTSTVQNYQFIDVSAKNGIQYYRLKQVDKDGSFEYSRTIAVAKEKNTTSKLYPNPAKDIVVLENKNPDSIKSLTVYNSMGQTVLIDIKSTNVLNISTLQTGLYFLEVKMEGNFKEIITFIKH